MLKIIRLFSLYLVLLFAVPANAEKEPRPGLYIELGEAFVFRIEDEQPVDVRPAVEGEALAPGEIRAALSSRSGTMMIIVSNSDSPLNYRAFIAKDEFKKGRRTSVCTLIPGVSVFESWPERLPGIRLTEFKPSDGGYVCR